MKEDETLELSLRLPGTDYSKNKYDGPYSSSLTAQFIEEFASKASDFEIKATKISTEEILRKFNIYGTITAGILFGNYEFRLVNFDSSGDILDQVSKKGLYNILSDSFVEQIQSRARKNGTRMEGNSLMAHEDTPYPVKALREILANAVAHALYQKHLGDIVVEAHPDRITVRNNCSKDARLFVNKWLSRIHRPTNKHLMNTLRAAGITDEQGTGKIRIFRLMLEAGKREPIIDFQELGDYCRWSITLFNEETNRPLIALSNQMKHSLTNEDQLRLAMAILLWRERPWTEVEQYLDEHYRYLAIQLLKNPNSPIIILENQIYTKRWARIALGESVGKQFSESEKNMFLKVLTTHAFSNGHDGHIEADMARKIIGLSDNQTEKTQLARLFSSWRDRHLVLQVRKGQWRFLKP